MATTRERDENRTGTAARPRSEDQARRRLQARRERPGPRRSQDAESVGEALEIERETGRREGAASRATRPVVRYGDGARPDAPPAPAPASSGPLGLSGMPSVGAPLALETLIIATDSFVNEHRFPIPSRLLAAWGLFTVLGFARGNAARPATALAWGLVIASFYSTVAPGTNALAVVGDFIGGKYADATTSATGGGAPPGISESGSMSSGSGNAPRPFQR